MTNYSSKGELDGDFLSFVNSVQDESPKLEVIFHNNALIKMFESTTYYEKSMQLTDLVELPLFSCEELNVPLSLLNAATNRYSDFMLG